jgi:hypothetical protein
MVEVLQRKFLTGLPLKPVPASGLVVQRMQITVNFSTTQMSFEFKELMRIWFSYSPDDGKNYGDQVARDFKVATRLGIAPYTTDNHASLPGGGGEGQKATEERANYQKWRRENAGMLDSVNVTFGGGGKTKTKYIPTEIEVKTHEQNKMIKKKGGAKSKHDQYHGSSNLGPAVYIETNSGTKCTVCNKFL